MSCFDPAGFDSTTTTTGLGSERAVTDGACAIAKGGWLVGLAKVAEEEIVKRIGGPAEGVYND
jgi:hypothetical protein